MNEYRAHTRCRRQWARRRAARRGVCLLLALCTVAAAGVIVAARLSAYASAAAQSGVPEPIAQETSMQESRAEETRVREAPWNLILVNKWNAVPGGYEVELAELENGERVDARIVQPLQAMLDAARSEQVYPVVVSGYRTEEEQQVLLDEKIAAYEADVCSAEEAVSRAEEWVAPPGASEHQLGLAVDINADAERSAGDEVYEWLRQNSHQFGFVCRYPPDKAEITGVMNEPWHYRYVGVEAAAAMYASGACLEEYLGKR